MEAVTAQLKSRTEIEVLQAIGEHRTINTIRAALRKARGEQ